MKPVFIVIFCLRCSLGLGQDSISSNLQVGSQIIILSDKVGAVVDSTEKKQYHLFPYYAFKDFESAELLRLEDSTMVLVARMRSGEVKQRTISTKELAMFRLVLGEPAQKQVLADPMNTERGRSEVIPGTKEQKAGLVMLGLASFVGLGGIVMGSSGVIGLGFVLVLGAVLAIPVGFVLAIIGTDKKSWHREQKQNAAAKTVLPVE